MTRAAWDWGLGAYLVVLPGGQAVPAAAHAGGRALVTQPGRRGNWKRGQCGRALPAAAHAGGRALLTRPTSPERLQACEALRCWLGSARAALLCALWWCGRDT